MGIERRTSNPVPSPPGGESDGLGAEHPDYPKPQPPPSSGVDASGRALPVPDDEWNARQAWLTRQLAEIDAEDDTPDDVYALFMRHVDEERRRAGGPPAFEGSY